jgi:2-polyprenyl-3-methyl-5-hydroxy-6-metoxy-1,4-benzoquinol methylase
MVDGVHQDATGMYRYADAELNVNHAYILPGLRRILTSETLSLRGSRIFDLGCGNGAVAAELTRWGFEVVGVDESPEGIEKANSHYPQLQLFAGSAYDDLAGLYGQFPLVISLEVVEHLFYPKTFSKTLYELVAPGGVAVVSTPYHGYIKNIALAVSGKMDKHFTALWDCGHIKFWSRRTLRVLLEQAGFSRIDFFRVGRIPPLAKSMFAVARKSI